MMFAKTFSCSMMSFGASAQAEAPAFGARSAADFAVSLLMGATFVASILICALLSLCAILAISLLVLALVLLAILLPAKWEYTPKMRRRA